MQLTFTILNYWCCTAGSNCSTALCEGNHEKSIPSVSRGFFTIAIGVQVHPSRSQIKKKCLKTFLDLVLYKGLKVRPRYLEVWEGQGADPPTSKKGTFFLCPWSHRTKAEERLRHQDHL